MINYSKSFLFLLCDCIVQPWEVKIHHMGVCGGGDSTFYKDQIWVYTASV